MKKNELISKLQSVKDQAENNLLDSSEVVRILLIEILLGYINDNEVRELIEEIPF